MSTLLYFIINPAASNGKAPVVWTAVKEYLDTLGQHYQYSFSDSAEHVEQLAKEAAAFPEVIVVSVGGDGTLSRVARALAFTGVAMGVIPGGTGNDFIRSFRIPVEPIAACEVLLNGKTIPLDIGEVNGSRFVNVLGAGLDAEVTADANRIFKKFSGALGYLLALLKQLIMYKPQAVRITVDGEVIETVAWLVSVANASYYGSGMKIAPHADPQDGKADVVIVGRLNRLKFLRLFPLVYKGEHVKHSAVQVIRGTTISIESHKPLHVHADGDLLTKTPLQIAMYQHALRLRVPD